MKFLCVLVFLTLAASTFSFSRQIGSPLGKLENRERHRHHKKMCEEFHKTHTCLKGEHCRVKDGEPMCVKKTCVTCVNDEEKPMCGSDGTTYKSYCQLRYVACTNDVKIHVACVGQCPCEDRVDQEHMLRTNQFVPGGLLTTKDSDEYLTEHSEDNDEDEYRKRIEHELKKNSKWQKWSNMLKSASKKVENEALSWKEKTNCTQKDLLAMPSRLLDWFHVLKADNIKAERRLRKKRDLTEISYLGSLTLEDVKLEKHEEVCHQPVLWMFNFLDTDKNQQLSDEEILTIEDIPYEHCMRPFFDSCNVFAPTDKFLTQEEFCNCFHNEETPCRKQLLNIPTAVIGGRVEPLLGAWQPRCDEDGFYQPSQCRENQCWCVDRLGVEIEDSRKPGQVYCFDNTEAQDEEEEEEEEKSLQ